MADHKQGFLEGFDFSQIPTDALKYDSVSVGDPGKLKKVSQSVGTFEAFCKLLKEAEGTDFCDSFVVEANGMSEFFGSVDYEYAVRTQCPTLAFPKKVVDILFDSMPGFAVFCIAPLVDDLINVELSYSNVATDVADDWQKIDGAVGDATKQLILEHASLLWHSRLLTMIENSDEVDYRGLSTQASDFIERVGIAVLSAVVRRISVNFKSPLDEDDFPRFSIAFDSDFCCFSVKTTVEGLQLSYDDLLLIHDGFPEGGYITLEKETEDDIVIGFHFPVK
jgi:hypothetical protein